MFETFTALFDWFGIVVFATTGRWSPRASRWT